MGTTDQSKSQALISEESRERDRGRGQGTDVITGEGHIKRDCSKYKAQDQSLKTATTAVMVVDKSDVLLAASEDGKSNWVLNSGRRDGATTTHKVMYFAAYLGGGCEAPQWGVARYLGEKVQSYGGTGSKAVKKDNLKTSDYAPVGWRGRLLSLAHLDEFKSSSQVQARLEFIWNVYVTVKLSSYLELFESVYLFVFLVRLG
ncbi:hypothetical protein Acr_00g0014520 [Actinidia rufa]|uniref:Uncharacterized protein n=1 Tax=Actinidia rufa TaxID=165716 RepID=A0A7J0DBQ4_9ERIC|nr:hypothetical protein Acr_00g0014520 [Actinidia rufa]